MSTRPPRDPLVTPSVATCPGCGAEMFAGDRYCGGCGAAVLVAAEAELLADLQQVTLGDYEIRGILGRGGMGLVYLAHDLALNRKVAIKVLPPFMLQGEDIVERFRREARTAASLRHRHITSVYGLRETTKLIFFVMEYVEGRALDAVLKAEGRLAADVVETVLHDTASALSYAHRREVVHRDLKPSNILIDVEGMALISDFGIAKVSTAPGLTVPGSMVGTPQYMSPEHWSGKATSASDQYSLGCVAYQLLAGRAPFEGQSVEDLMRQHLFELPEPLSGLRPDCPPALAAGVMRMLEKDPNRRFALLDAVIAAMKLRSAPPDDPVRQTLARLASRGHEVRTLPRTPKSPIPISRSRSQRTSDSQTTRKGRPLGWAAAASIIAILGVGAYLKPWKPRVTPAEPIARIEIAGVPATLSPGERAPLAARATNAAGKSVGAAVSWSSSDRSVAFVSGDTLTAVSPGIATLTATNGGKSTSVTVVVRPAPRVATLEVAPREARLVPGETVRLVAVARDAQGNLLTERRVEWSSSNLAIATVSPSGMVTGIAEGMAVVTGTGDGRSAAVPIAVGAAAGAASLDVMPPRVRIAVRQTSVLHVTVLDSRGRILSGRRVRWASSDPAVAAVSSGVVTGVAPGTASITATADGVTSDPTEATVVAGPSKTAIVRMLITPWANVFIDGVPRGQRTRGEDTVTAGNAHRLRFEREGFVTVDTAVALRPGEQRLLRIHMLTRDR